MVIQDVVMPRCAASRAPSLPEARQADGLQRLVQAGGHLCPRRDELGEPFRENLTHTLDGVTKELTDMQIQLHLLSSTGEVFHQSAIAAMQAGSWLVTQWTPSAA